MNDNTMTILSDNSTWTPLAGENTSLLREKLGETIGSEAADVVINEASNILSHCIPPRQEGNITNIAVGYIQSGKTMSFTTLTTLAADNGYSMIVMLAGSKLNLLKQTIDRLSDDLADLSDGRRKIKVIEEADATFRFIRQTIDRDKVTIVLPILKHYSHIDKMADVFRYVDVAPLLKNHSVLIVDDEADQTSLNTFASSNAKKAQNEEWGEDEFSSTYSSINNLRQSLPCHSYVQYTATPQAQFLIDNSDLLSPKYFTVLTPGEGYTGGKFFFGSDEALEKFVRVIPDEDAYHTKRNPLKNRPKSLDKALLEFFVGVIIVTKIQKRLPFLSMMVHIDGLRDANEKFRKFIEQWIDEWQGFRKSSFASKYKEELRTAYDEMTKYVENAPTYEEVEDNLEDVLFDETKIHLVQPANGMATPEIDWSDKSYKARILVGAEMLNRGFTVKNLSMSYMPRSVKGPVNSDTLEQRARFFGYRKSYADVIRIYLTQRSIDNYNLYVKGEEFFRNQLMSVKSQSMEELGRALMNYPDMRPTRANVLSKSIIKYKMHGWHQMRSTLLKENNITLVENLLSQTESDSWQIHPEANMSDAAQKHVFADISIDKFCEFWKEFEYNDVPNKVRKIATIQYIKSLLDDGKSKVVHLVNMSCGGVRERKITATDDRSYNLQVGRSNNYNGDQSVKFDDDAITVQIHHVKFKYQGSDYNGREVYNLAIYYPNSLAAELQTVEDDSDEDDD